MSTDFLNTPVDLRDALQVGGVGGFMGLDVTRGFFAACQTMIWSLHGINVGSLPIRVFAPATAALGVLGAALADRSEPFAYQYNIIFFGGLSTGALCAFAPYRGLLHTSATGLVAGMGVGMIFKSCFKKA